jgi:hypothetical protein
MWQFKLYAFLWEIMPVQKFRTILAIYAKTAWPLHWEWPVKNSLS